MSRSRLLYATLLVAGCGRLGFESIGAEVTGDLTFDNLACGGSTTAILSLHNSNAMAIDFACTSTIGAVAIAPASGTLAADAQIALVATLTAPLESIPGASVDGDLVCQAGVETVDLPIHLTTSGGVLVLDQASLDFGQIQDNATATRVLTLHNTGDATVMVSAGAFADPAYSITGATTLQLDGGASGGFAVAFMPQQQQIFTDSLPLMVTGNLCRPPPSAVAVIGAAVAGTVLLDHTTLDFGDVTCGATATALGLKITNLAAPTTFTAAIASGAYDVTPGSGNLPVGDTGLTVTPRTVVVPTTPGQLTGSLHVDIANPVESQDVTLHQTIVGPSLGADRTSIDFGLVAQNTSAQLTVQVSNTGNDIAAVQVVPVGGASSRTTVSPTSFQVPPGASQPVIFTFTNHDNVQGGIAVPSTQMVTADFQISATDQCSATLTIHTVGSIADN